MRERGIDPRVFLSCSWADLSYPALFQVVLELARVSLLQGHLDLCEQHCAVLLETEKNQETASVVRVPRPPQPPPGDHLQAAS